MDGKKTSSNRNHTVFVCGPPPGEEKELESIRIIIPPKPGEEDTYCAEDPETLDVCALSMSSLGKETNLPSSKLPFTWKLFEMLNDVEEQGQSHVVSWVDGGRAFMVHDLKAFVDEIVPIYFKQSKYKSFQRQLYFYGFTRITSGPDAGAYYHPKFVRGRKTLCLRMTPKKGKGKDDQKVLVPKDEQEMAGSTPAIPDKEAPPSTSQQAPRRVSGKTFNEMSDEMSHVPNCADAHYPTECHDQEYAQQLDPDWTIQMMNVISNGAASVSKSAARPPPRVSFLDNEMTLPYQGPCYDECGQSWRQQWQEQQQQQQEPFAEHHSRQRLLCDGNDCDIFGDMTFHSVENSSI